MSQTAEHPITPALSSYKAAKAEHLKNEATYEDIIASIARSQQKQRDAENQSQQADGSWRKLFRSLRGEMTDELQTEHIRRISQRELAQEFGHLIEELELDKDYTSLQLCASARPYKDTHKVALMEYARLEMSAAMKNPVTRTHPGSENNGSCERTLHRLITGEGTGYTDSDSSFISGALFV